MRVNAARILTLVGVVLAAAGSLLAQSFPSPSYFRQLLRAPELAITLPGPQGLESRMVNGKLRLTLAEAVQLMLQNSPDVQIQRLQHEASGFSLARAFQPFDPFFTSSFVSNRSSSPTTSQLQGASTLSNLSQTTQFGYSQLFRTGLRYDLNLTANRASTNSVFATFNPSIFSTLNLSLTQPLLRNRGRLSNEAPILIAQRNLRQSRASFEAALNGAIARIVDQYLSVLQARENLRVLRQSQQQAETSYQQDRRALDLGALSPLDIFRSESQVASRRLQVIQAEFSLKQLEDQLRTGLGADRSAVLATVELELVESITVDSASTFPDQDQAVRQALESRPELEALRQQIENDDIGIRVAHQNLQPDLNFTGFYSTSGRGGNRIDTAAVPPRIIERGGLGSAFSQLGSFDFPTYGFNLQLRLPVRNRAAEADLGNALLTKRRNLYVLQENEQAIALEARTAVLQLEQARLSIEAARIARDLAQKNLEAEQRKHELGVQTIFFVLDAQTQLAQAELSLLQAEIGHRRARNALDRATAGLLARFGIQIAAAGQALP